MDTLILHIRETENRFCLNPCFNGMDTLTGIYDFRQLNDFVSILVLMEWTL